MSDGGVGNLPYDEAKAHIQSADPRVRAELAGRADLRPEMLYYLAEDAEAAVRVEVAANAATPYQADVLLSEDRDEAVRAGLAAKVARVLPGLGPAEHKRAEAYVEKVLVTLARDEAVRVRRVLAEAVKDLTEVPGEVVQRLARDATPAVATPVLEFSPLLSEADLIEIIEAGCAEGQLEAISRRRGLGAPVADAVVAVDSEPATAALLANDSAQIREETLDLLVERARKVVAWQEPLVARPKLSMAAVRKLAAFVADRLVEDLEARQDLDSKTAKSLAKEVKKRLKAREKAAREKSRQEDEEVSPEERAKALEAKGELTEAVIAEALGAGDRGFVAAALAEKSGLAETAIAKVLDAQSAKGVVSLAWKAGLSAEFAVQLQTRLGGIAPGDLLRPRGGGYPLSEDEMTWQLELFESMAG
ncbi:MAG: DUF2336 domain-containing protein [Kiloniellales bacterium]|nr:DUF2336 domain-containing protein [Kiloniellales bacterium]